jgi:hypothetical protein
MPASARSAGTGASPASAIAAADPPTGQFGPIFSADLVARQEAAKDVRDIAWSKRLVKALDQCLAVIPYAGTRKGPEQVRQLFFGPLAPSETTRNPTIQPPLAQAEQASGIGATPLL